MRKLPLQRLTKKQKLVAELFACDYNIPEAAVKTGMSRLSIEKITRRAKEVYNVKHIHGMVVEAIRHGDIQIEALRKKERCS